MATAGTPAEAKRAEAINREQWKRFFDSDGRLVNEIEMRKAMFEGGADADIRADVWKFLYKLYPFHSTVLEQKTMDLERLARYKALKARWKVLDQTMVVSGDPFLGRVPDYMSAAEDEEAPAPLRDLHEDDAALLAILDFPAKVFAQHQDVNLEHYLQVKRVILKDVLRTDRFLAYFKDDRNLRKVHVILMIYAMFHPGLSYSQGMNDILARFLLVLHNEVDCYWAFVQYMEHKKNDFAEDTMIKKVGIVRELVQEMDPELYEFFEETECRDYLFCHRWLLLSFKREFEMEDSLRVFEVISSSYLELSTDQAMKESAKEAAKLFQKDGGSVRADQTSYNMEYTFEVFLCVAILLLHKVQFMQSPEPGDLYTCVNK